MNPHHSQNDHVVAVQQGVTVPIIVIGHSGEVAARAHGESFGRGQEAIDGAGPDGSRGTCIVDVHGLNRRKGISIEVPQLRRPCWHRKTQVLVHIGGGGEKSG